MKLEKFKRQYVFFPKDIKHDSFNSWQRIETGKYCLLAEESLNIQKETSKNDYEALLIGYWVNPRKPELNNKDILKEICKEETPSIDKISSKIYSLSGRFVLIINKDDNLLVFNDASGFRNVQYIFKNNEFFMTSNINALSLVIDIGLKSKELDQFQNSDYYLNTKTFMHPVNYSFYEDVETLIPNHYIEVTSRRQIRFYPNKKLIQLESQEEVKKCIKKISQLLKEGISAVKKRNELSLSITSGNDSRVLLSLVKEHAKKTFFWVSYESKKEADYFLPKLMLEKLLLKFNPIKLKKASKKYLNFYKQNTPISHALWADYNFSYLETYPENYIVVRGVAAEIARNYYYPKNEIHPEEVTEEYLQGISNMSFLSLDFLKEKLFRWLKETQPVVKKYNYNVLDFLFWEHREGMWQAQSQSESDHIFEVFVPYNNREILDLMFSLPNKLRGKKDPVFYNEIIKLNWPELLDFPINPKAKHSDLELKAKYYKEASIFKIKKLLLKLKKR